MNPPPHIPPEVAAYLDKLHPARCPELDWPDRKVWAEVGRRSVVEHLQSLVSQQQANILKET